MIQKNPANNKFMIDTIMFNIGIGINTAYNPCKHIPPIVVKINPKNPCKQLRDNDAPYVKLCIPLSVLSAKMKGKPPNNGIITSKKIKGCVIDPAHETTGIIYTTARIS